MTDQPQQPDQTPTEQPISLTADEIAMLTAYRAGKPFDMVDLYTERHKLPPLPDDTVFPHDDEYAQRLTVFYDPYNERNETAAAVEYRQKYDVSWQVAFAAVERIFKHATREPDEGERKLLKAIRGGNIDFARGILTELSEQYEPDALDEPPRDMLNIGEQIAFAVIGKLALEGTINRDYLEDSDYLTSFIIDIAAGINYALPQVDHVSVDRMFARHRAARRS